MPMLNVDGDHIYFSVKGKGIPIVLIHPPVLTSVNFEYQMEELSHSFQVITFDIRGHGKSSYSTKSINYPLIVNDIKQIFDHLKIEKAFICGYSTGASIALEFLLNVKERSLGGILISGISEINTWRLKNRVFFAKRLAKMGTVTFLAWSIAKSNSDTKILFEKMFNDAKDGDHRNIQQYYDYSLNYNCTAQLNNIHLPCMLIYGKKDKQFYNYAQILHENLPSNQLLFIENVSHQIPTKAWKECNQWISQFIKKNRSEF
ncbi:alpha/beta fold hydrolase [Neobacillus sp. SM06]|uniref:alpha/beta fold hydrolase n=1 Tax=Neobacillus sp. SM06 TaxID=3422492 RepID=UPI003D2E4964